MIERFVNKTHCGDSRTILPMMPEESIQCVVTSPPYWGLRDYKVDGQIGLEKSLSEYLTKISEVFREVYRVLAMDGTLWLNMGDAHASGKGTCYNPGGGDSSMSNNKKDAGAYPLDRHNKSDLKKMRLKPKDLIGMPWRMALMLQSEGWYLRQCMIWNKPACMPESCQDRPSTSHEYIFLMAKSEVYYYDADAIKEPIAESSVERYKQDIKNQKGSDRAHAGEDRQGRPMKAVGGWQDGPGNHCTVEHNQGDRGGRRNTFARSGPVSEHIIPGQAHAQHRPDREPLQMSEYRNKRSVWTISPERAKGAHFATFPEKLVKPCILAGTRAGDIVLDPFHGSGTTGRVASHFGRKWIGIELNPEYIKLSNERTAQIGIAL